MSFPLINKSHFWENVVTSSSSQNTFGSSSMQNINMHDCTENSCFSLYYQCTLTLHAFFVSAR